MASGIMIGSEKQLRQSVLRYVQLLLAIGTALTLFFFVGGVIDTLIDGGSISAWIRARYARIIFAPWSIVFIIFVGDVLTSWRHPVWCVDATGISVRTTKRSKPRLVPWSDIASVRVSPLGIVTMTTTCKPSRVSVAVAVTRQDALWLRDFASIQLAKKTP